MIKIVNVISSNAKFPLDYTKGSQTRKFNQAKLLTQNVFDYMKNNCKNSWSVNQLKYAIDKYAHPYKINLMIEKEYNYHYLGNLQDDVSVNNYLNTTEYIVKNSGKKPPISSHKPFILASLDGFKLKFQLDNNGNIQNKYALLHEVRHLFDKLCNPKMSVMRRNIMADSPKEQYNAYKKINILQGIRNAVKTEINAYNQEFREYCKKPFANFENIINLYLFKNNNAKFDKKLKFVNELLSDCIKKERMNNR